MPFITKVDFARQVKQYSGTTTFLSGSTNVNENFSATTIFSGSSNIDSLFQNRGMFRDIYFDAAEFTPLINSGATFNTEEYTGSSINTGNLISDYYSFTGSSTDESIQVRLKFPDEYDLGTIKTKIYWDPASGSTIGEQVTWGIRGRNFNNNYTLSAETIFGTEVKVTDTILLVENLHITSASTEITISGEPALDGLVYLQVTRKVNDSTDTSLKSAKFLGMAIQYKEHLTGTTIW